MLKYLGPSSYGYEYDHKGQQIATNYPIYCVGKITNIVWTTQYQNELCISIDFIEKSGIGFEREKDKFYLKYDWRDRPNYQYKIGDMVMFYGNEKTYDIFYAQKRGLERKSLYAYRIAVVNHLLNNNKEDTKKWFLDVIEQKKFDQLCDLQTEAIKKGTMSLSDTVNIINQEMINEPKERSKRAIEQFNFMNQLNKKEKEK